MRGPQALRQGGLTGRCPAGRAVPPAPVPMPGCLLPVPASCIVPVPRMMADDRPCVRASSDALPPAGTDASGAAPAHVHAAGRAPG